MIDRQHVPLAAAAVARVEAIAGIGAVQRFRMTEQRARGVGFRLVATDVETFVRNVTDALTSARPSHGRRGFSRLFLGSVAARVVASAPCPVLVVPAPRGRRTS